MDIHGGIVWMQRIDSLGVPHLAQAVWRGMTICSRRRAPGAGLLLWVSLFGIAGVTRPREGTGQEIRVTGTVVESVTGAPIAGALIVLTPSEGASVSATSTETGDFVIRALVPTTAHISATAGVRDYVPGDLGQSDRVNQFPGRQQPSVECDLGTVDLRFESTVKRQP